MFVSRYPIGLTNKRKSSIAHHCEVKKLETHASDSDQKCRPELGARHANDNRRVPAAPIGNGGVGFRNGPNTPLSVNSDKSQQRDTPKLPHPKLRKRYPKQPRREEGWLPSTKKNNKTLKEAKPALKLKQTNEDECRTQPTHVPVPSDRRSSGFN